jgi:mannose-6-phosphate isomerase-like protein (cupin superfamily)
MEAKDVIAAVKAVPEGEFVNLGSFNKGHVGVFQASDGQSPWERHPHDEELLFVLEGEVIITILTEDGPVDTTVKAGSLIVVPRNHWHRHTHPGHMVELYLTPGKTDMSFEDIPST